MTNHKTAKREEWLAARLELLKAEKELTRLSDEMAQRRQKLPWVRFDKDYSFETDEGKASLADLFRGPTTKRGVRPAQPSRTGSTASQFISPIMT
jgi:predicted dithiol-disulfide oxidoreductase (DUF899 family)